MRNYQFFFALVVKKIAVSYNLEVPEGFLCGFLRPKKLEIKMNEIKTSFKGVFLLLLTAFIWGTSFIAQSESIGKVEPFTFNCVRTLIGGLFLLPVILLKGRFFRERGQDFNAGTCGIKKHLFYGILLGVVLCIATNFQQFAFEQPEHSAGKIAFITAMYLFMVPVFGIFFKKKVSVFIWLSIAAGFTGLYFLCIDSRGLGSLTKGDFLAFLGSVFFAVHIVLIALWAPGLDGIKLSCIQFFVSGLLSGIGMALFEKPCIADIFSAGLPILYAGVLSCGVAYTLQIVGQQYCEETVASLIMCMESVFAALSEAFCSAVFGMGGKVLSGREVFGCAIMFCAIVCAQIFQAREGRKKAAC